MDRYSEIDAARGIAILMMIIFHTVFDLYFFSIYPVNVSSGFWRYFAFSTASLFLLIAGISLSISHSRAMRLAGDGVPVRIAGKFLRRGAGIFACGVLVTVATWLYLGQGFVIFGILHTIGVSIMLSPLFFRFRSNNIIIGSVVVFIGIAIAYAGIPGPLWLCPFGIHPAAFVSVDYTPLFPWFGLVLIGLGIGESIYPGGRRGFEAPAIPFIFMSPLAVLGRHSLVIYLVHQPAIILLLHFVAGIPLL
ncbi:MAG: heparan-alpha-glucosaminide N-acetyltransferase [Methanoregula sp.]|nr:MAG: heparan-alpha-glucosaminide N-acetyltransferase [Methanoregula sp.]